MWILNTYGRWSYLVVCATLFSPATCVGQGNNNHRTAHLMSLVSANAKQVTLDVSGTSFRLVRIPPGEFDLGAGAADAMAQPAEQPVRHIQITKPFYIGSTEVSQSQYHAVMGDHRNNFSGDNLPVEDLTYVQARQFCESANATIGRHGNAADGGPMGICLSSGNEHPLLFW